MKGIQKTSRIIYQQIGALSGSQAGLDNGILTAGFYLYINCLLYTSLPYFLEAKAAFYAEPVSDLTASILSTIVFLLVIDKHLKKREMAHPAPEIHL